MFSHIKIHPHFGSSPGGIIRAKANGQDAHGLVQLHVAKLQVLFQLRPGGGGGIAVREGPIQLRMIAGKLRKIAEKVVVLYSNQTEPPKASRSNNSAQEPQNVETDRIVHRYQNYDDKRPSISP